MRIEIPEYKKWVHEMRFKVRWGDMDAMGHVNNAMYFRYLETARIDWMVEAGMAPTPGGQGPVIVNAFATSTSNWPIPTKYCSRCTSATPAAPPSRPGEPWNASPNPA